MADRIVPRLLARQRRRRSDEAVFSPERVAAFAALLLTASFGTVANAVDDAVAGGIAMDMIFLHLLAPAARHLGDLWLSDRLSFLDVTRGTSTLQALLRRLAPEFEAHILPGTAERSILLAPVPGEQHVFGLSMVSVFFRRAGWRVVYEPRADENQISARLAAEPFDAIGFSAAGTRFAERLPDLVKRVRCASANPELRVIAGGPAFLDTRGLDGFVNADAVARDAAGAVNAAEALVSRRKCQA